MLTIEIKKKKIPRIRFSGGLFLTDETIIYIYIYISMCTCEFEYLYKYTTRRTCMTVTGVVEGLRRRGSM